MPAEHIAASPPMAGDGGDDGGEPRINDGVDRRFGGLSRIWLADHLVLIKATTHRSRRRGLARLDSLARDHALHIPGTSSVHTFGMRFDLDLIWLGRGGAVLRVDRVVPRGRTRWCPRARSVIETVAGQADAFLEAGASQATTR